MKLKTYVTAGLLTLGAPLAAQAGVNLNFDTQGIAGVIEINAFDWAQNSFLALGGTEAIVARQIADLTQTECGTACDFTVYTQGTLSVTTLDGTPNWTPLQDGAEITFTLQFTETVVSATPEQAVLESVNDGALRFEMYYDDVINDGTQANALTGSGYTDGTLILFGTEMGTPLSTGTFNNEQDADGNFIVENIDQSGDDDYTGQDTVRGAGSQSTIEVGGLTQDNNFFLDQLQQFGFDFTNLSFNNPYTNVSPSDCFNESTNSAAGVGSSSAGAGGCANNHVNGLFEANEGDASATTFVPRTGSVNGDPSQGLYGGNNCASFGPGGVPDVSACPDFVAQTDVNSGVQIEVEEVPEPGTLAMAGLGLLLLGFGRRRNRA